MIEIKVTVDIPAVDNLVNMLAAQVGNVTPKQTAAVQKGEPEAVKEDAPETPTETAEKPKRKRRTKAQIEADKKAAEEAAAAEAEKDNDSGEDEDTDQDVSDDDNGSDDEPDTSDDSELDEDDTDDELSIEDDQDDGETVYEIKDVQQVMIDLSAKKGREAAKKILTKFGASTLLKLDKSDYAEVVRLAKKAMN